MYLLMYLHKEKNIEKLHSELHRKSIEINTFKKINLLKEIIAKISKK